MTGYTIGIFETMYPYFEETHKAYLSQYRMTGQRRKPPTGKQKAENRKISSVRVVVEHVTGSTKRCRTVKDECRLRKDDFVKFIFHTYAALHNFRINSNPFQYEFN
jgi:hypothetical protein